MLKTGTQYYGDLVTPSDCLPRQCPRCGKTAFTMEQLSRYFPVRGRLNSGPHLSFSQTPAPSREGLCNHCERQILSGVGRALVGAALVQENLSQPENTSLIKAQVETPTADADRNSQSAAVPAPALNAPCREPSQALSEPNLTADRISTAPHKDTDDPSPARDEAPAPSAGQDNSTPLSGTLPKA